MLLTTYQVASNQVQVDKWATMIFFALIVIGFMASIVMRAYGYGVEVLQSHKDDDDVGDVQEVQETTQDKAI